MPDGVGVETVFAPLQNGTELQARIMPIYTATAQQTQEDFLKPHFKLYLAGRQITFERGEVVVFTR